MGEFRLDDGRFVIPVPIGRGFVEIWNVPTDLSEDEAERIATAVRAFAKPTDHQKQEKDDGV